LIYKDTHIIRKIFLLILKANLQVRKIILYLWWQVKYAVYETDGYQTNNPDDTVLPFTAIIFKWNFS